MLITIFSIFFVFNANAQWWGTNPVYTTSNVGIGLTNPATKLHVLGVTTLDGNVQIGSKPIPANTRLMIDGNMMFDRHSDGGWEGIRAKTLTGCFDISVQDGPGIGLFGKDFPATAWDNRSGAIHIISYGTTGDGTVFMNYDPVAVTWKKTMTVTSDNRVFIGNFQPNGTFADYRLGVDGLLVTRRLVVQNNSWADDVFGDDYELMPLEEVEQFITDNKHLPDIPCEEEVLSNGVDVGEMNKLLLQKVEELTLYMIALKKENELIKAKLEMK